MQRLQEYVKYTKAELDSYSETKGSCVYKINQNLHFAINAYILNDMNAALPAYVLKNKVGYFDSSLNGIILAVKNIKVLNGAAALRFDDPKLHIDINADCYVFRPEEGAVLTGIAKHVGKHHVGIIIYGVFNASVRLEELVNKAEVKLNQELKFQVKNFNIRIAHPYIQGTLLNVKREKDISAKEKNQATKITFKSVDEDSNDDSNDVNNQKTLLNVKREKDIPAKRKNQAKKITFKSDDEDSNDDFNDSNEQERLLNVKKEKDIPAKETDDENSNDGFNDVSNYTPDSGIEEKESNDRDMELSELLNLIKNEPLSEHEEDIEIKKDYVDSKKRTRRGTESSDTAIPTAKIKSEPNNFKQKNLKTEPSENSECTKEKTHSVKKKIKKEKYD